MAPLDTTIRRLGPDAPPALPPWTGVLNPDNPPPGSTVVEANDDGGVTVRTVAEKRKPSGFGENLAESERVRLADIADDILRGVESDIQGRTEFTSNVTRGMDLLGLTIENQEHTKGQKRKTATSKDTTLLESVVKAQSQARGELLPASGPAKVVTVAEAGEVEDTRAADFEADFNLALTKGMPEYVPDLDRGLFGFFFGGNMFRYGYIDPLKKRPMVETVGVEDLIVSQEATSLDTATRWTMRVPAMAPKEVRRRQLYGIWRECDLGVPMPDTDAAQQKKDQIAGTTGQSMRPQDQPFVIYQTVTDLDPEMYGLGSEGAPEGLPLPYRVTVEKHSRQVLRIERFWREGDTKFNRKRRCVHYGMVPGFGFLAYGFLHLQGNQVNTLTAIIRLLIDAMMFGNFPGGMKAKGVRTETNEIDPGPGEWVEVGVPANMDDIRKAIMALPYKDVSAVSIQLYELIQQATARVGAAAMLEVGEGRANVPVGTIMAMLEEKSVVMSAVHKRLHEAMSQELSMIRELFAECPETLAQVLDNPRRQWAAAEEFMDLDLVPASDPNVPSNVHRMMLATALATLAGMPVFTQRLDMGDLLKRILRMVGISDVDVLVVDPPPQQGDPGAAAANAQITKAQIDAASKAQENQRKAANEAVAAQQKMRESQNDLVNDAANRASQERIAALREHTELVRLSVEEQRAQREHAHAVEQAAMQDRHHEMDAAREDRNAEADRATRQFGGQGL